MDTHPTNRRTLGIVLILRLIGIAALLWLLLIVGVAFAATQIQDINPDTSDLSDPDGATGGRTNGLASVASNNQVFYAATEFGGLFKTTNGGNNWSRLDRHLPTTTWDVEVDPANANRVYATSRYDGRVNSISGIQVSTDAGATWSHPASATPPTGFSCTNATDEPAAFGIGIRPDATQNVFIGTNCGLARSIDSGATWAFSDPVTPAGVASNVWDVVVQGGGPTGQGIVDSCGNKRHRRSTDGGATWTGGNTGLPAGRCSIAVSPDESYVLFVAAADNRIYESDDGGATWTNLGTPDPKPQGRIPFVVTNQRSDSGGVNRFDLWFGDVRLYRAGCTTPATPAPGGATRCPTAPAGWAGPFTRSAGAHDDVGDLVFDTAVAIDSCPRILSSDGGVHRNTDLGADCQNPDWTRSNVGLHATWVWSLAGADRPGDAAEDLYFGLQDDGPFGTTNAGAASPTWHNADCCDIFDVVADPNRVLYTFCCTGPRATILNMRNPGMVGGGQINTYPADGLLPGFNFPDSLDQFGDKKYVLVVVDCINTLTDGIDNDGDGMVDEADEANGCSGVNGGDGGVYITNDITASPIVWTELGAASDPNGYAVQAAVSGGTPTFYVQVAAGNQVWRFSGTGAGTWQRIDTNDGLPGGLAVFAADPGNPNRLYAATNAGFIFFSNDGGVNWNPDPELDNLMIGGGFFKYRQPTLLAFDPADSNFVVAGGKDSGVFLSTDGGQNWGRLTDPINSGASGIPHLPEPRFAYFDHEPADRVNIYIGTRGRGVWRFVVRVPVADANGPYVTNEGTNVTLNGTGSSDPDGATLTYDWDLDNDGQFDDATGPNPTFDLVGQDGVFPIALRVTAGGVVDVDTSTVTVNNVAPAVSLSSDAPKDEGSPLTVNGTVTDPGWLDPLAATINWGDGSPAEPIVGTLENTRPDATLTFNASHTYGDNGAYNVQVCASDDDTTTCTIIVVQINNVPPQVAIAPGQVTTINEGDFVNILATFSDPGWLDTYTSLIEWGTGESEPGTLTVTVNGPPADQGTLTGSHQYGDNGVFMVKATVTDDDGGVGLDSFNLTVKNVAPTAEIDETGAIPINGVPTFLAHAGAPLDFSGRSQDPGSDDLFLSWDWDDGPPAPDVTTTYLVNPPNPDPFPSPSVQPRDVTDTKTHAFGDACLYTIRFRSADDDGGASLDSAKVLIVGNDGRAHPQGYWQHQFSRNGHTDFDEATLQCYLAIIDHVSQVFNERRDASSIEKAYDVLFMQQNGGSAREQFDRELLTVWLNFANGALEYNKIAEVVAAAEAVRLNPNATEAQIRAQGNILHQIR